MINTREHEETLKDMLANYCLLTVDLEFVENVKAWCDRNGISEPDRDKPIKLVVRDNESCKLIVKDYVEKKTVDGRINALRVRGALQNVAMDRAEMLDSDHKKLAYLFLSEYAAALPEMDDELVADNWIFRELERLGFFRL